MSDENLVVVNTKQQKKTPLRLWSKREDIPAGELPAKLQKEEILMVVPKGIDQEMTRQSSPVSCQQERPLTVHRTHAMLFMPHLAYLDVDVKGWVDTVDC